MSPASSATGSDVIFWHLFYSGSAILLHSNPQKSYSLMLAINAVGKGEMLGKGYLQSSRGSPAAQQDIYMDRAQQHGTWSLWGAWAWVPQGIWWLPCPLLLGSNHRQRALALVCAKYTNAIIAFLFIWKVCLDFHGNKTAVLCIFHLKSEVAGACRRSWYFTSGRGKAVTYFFSALTQEMGKLSWLKLLECGRKSTDNRCSLCKI